MRELPAYICKQRLPYTATFRGNFAVNAIFGHFGIPSSPIHQHHKQIRASHFILWARCHVIGFSWNEKKNHFFFSVADMTCIRSPLTTLSRHHKIESRVEHSRHELNDIQKCDMLQLYTVRSHFLCGSHFFFYVGSLSVSWCECRRRVWKYTFSLALRGEIQVHNKCVDFLCYVCIDIIFLCSKA